MPRSFDVSTETSASVGEVLTAFGHRDYWLARLAAYGGESMTLNELEVGTDGSVAVKTTQDLARGALPGAFARALPRNLELVRTESWQPVGDEVRGAVTIAAHGVPGSGAGTTVLDAVPAGSRLRFTGSLEVRIPLVGGRIEQFIADLIAKEVPDMQRFTTDWIAEHG